jgi:beta-lactam-binding protein with PASTA domain
VRVIGRLGPLAIAIMIAGCGGSSGSSTTASSTTGQGTQAASPAQAPEVRVPDLVGERFGQAVRDVERIGLEQTAPAFTGTVGNPHFNGHCQKILHQSPPPGTKVAKGYTVSIVYGVCPKSIQNPRRKPHG